MTLPPADWYEDPKDSSMRRYWDGTAWTDFTRPPEVRTPPPPPGPIVGSTITPGASAPVGFTQPAPKKNRNLAIGLSVGGGVVLLAIIGAVLLGVFYIGKVKTHEHTVTEMVAPAGWEVQMSTHDGFAFAVDPSWIDVRSADFDKEFDTGSSGAIAYTLEIGGVWQTAQYADGTASILEVIGGTYRVTSVNLEAEMRVAADSAASGLGGGETKILRDKAISNPLGYDARIQVFTVTTDSQVFYMGVVGVAEGDTLIFPMMISLQDPSAWEDDLIKVGESVVILGTK